MKTVTRHQKKVKGNRTLVIMSWVVFLYFISTFTYDVLYNCALSINIVVLSRYNQKCAAFPLAGGVNFICHLLRVKYSFLANLKRLVCTVKITFYTHTYIHYHRKIKLHMFVST